MPNRRSTLSPARLGARGPLDEAGAAPTPHPNPASRCPEASAAAARGPNHAAHLSPPPPSRAGAPRAAPGALLPHTALRRRRAATAGYLLQAAGAQQSLPAGSRSRVTSLCSAPRPRPCPPRFAPPGGMCTPRDRAGRGGAVRPRTLMHCACALRASLPNLCKPQLAVSPSGTGEQGVRRSMECVEGSEEKAKIEGA